MCVCVYRGTLAFGEFTIQSWIFPEFFRQIKWEILENQDFIFLVFFFLFRKLIWCVGYTLTRISLFWRWWSQFSASQRTPMKGWRCRQLFSAPPWFPRFWRRPLVLVLHSRCIYIYSTHFMSFNSKFFSSFTIFYI